MYKTNTPCCVRANLIFRTFVKLMVHLPETLNRGESHFYCKFNSKKMTNENPLIVSENDYYAAAVSLMTIVLGSLTWMVMEILKATWNTY